ncbi:MAG: glycosyltransferase [Candidatus Latescibacterota bacterium]|nr:MAG: glycosyltransferase [Candidatus Latescibacterota bacterium]
MRILHITPSIQHPTMRGADRHYHFIRELSRRHSITLLSLTREPMTRAAADELSQYTERILTFATHGAAKTTASDRLKRLLGRRVQNELSVRQAASRMRRAFDTLVRSEPFDVVLFHGKHLLSVIDDTRGLPLVIDFCDATSMRIGTTMRFAKLTRLPLLTARYLQVKGIEKRLLKRSPHRAFISARDRDAVLGRSSGAMVVANGVDRSYWHRQRGSRPRDHCIIFTGVMDYAPNEDAALLLIEKIVPLMRRAIPDLEVVIAGRDPSMRLQERARNVPGVQVTGFVEDMRPYLERAAVFVAPLRFAAGMQNKVLEAMAMQMPVVATPVVADGLRTGSEDAPVRVADDILEFAEATVHLLKHSAQRDAVAMQARRFVEKHFSWKNSARLLEQMCLAAAGQAEPAFERQATAVEASRDRAA